MILGVAILGSGIFVREEHLPAVQKSPNLTLRAIYSRSLKSAQSLNTEASVDLYSNDAGAGKSLDDLLNRTDIQAVIIALPIKNQPEYIRKCLVAGKNVLSEKPVAENVAEALDLITWYDQQIRPRGISWAVAENARFWESCVKGGQISARLGKLLTFRARQQTLVKGGKYFETEWRKTPTHQGGFLLDGGVHFTAALRQLLGKDAIVSLSAHTAQLQEHLPPVDTIQATARTKNGAIGTISISFGTTDEGNEYSVGREDGFVTVNLEGLVKTKEKEETIEKRESHVTIEVRAWGEALVGGRIDPLQSPREALADLELIEACLRSGEQGAKVVELKHQEI